MKKHLAALSLFLTAFAGSPLVQAAEATAQADQAIAAAESAYKKADEVGFAWRDTEDLIKQAKEAAQKNDHENAVKLAKQAEYEGKMAYAQYEQQQKKVARR